MSELSNEYSKLFDYLDFHKKASGGNRKKVVKKPPEDKSKQKKQKIAAETLKLLEESEIHSYIPAHLPKTSSGFDVEKFEVLMRTKLIDDYKRLQSYERPYISVGELYTCNRQNYYARLRYPVDIREQFRFAYLYLIQRIGNEIHAIVQDLYDFTEFEKTVVSEKYKVKGRIDGIRESYLYEIKSIDPEKFKNEYIKEHFFQANIYAYILNSEYDYKIEKVSIVYVSRNLKRVIPFDIPINDSLAKSHLSRAPLLLKAVSKREVIDPIGATNEQCKYCLYKDYCKKDKCIEIVQPFVKKAQKKEEAKTNRKKTAFLL
jgi:CRISPR/Cas system-associated exonuclease Cas4 (RecB family)